MVEKLFFHNVYVYWLHLMDISLMQRNICILNPYLPIMATSVQRPLSSVPKVALVGRFDYIILLDCVMLINIGCIHFSMPSVTMTIRQSS